MSKETLVFLIGIILTIIPFIGIPPTWSLYGTVFLGGLLILTGYRLRRSQFLKMIDQGDGERRTDSFVETTKTLFDGSKVE